MHDNLEAVRPAHRAHMVVFRRRDCVYEEHHFEVAGEDTVRIRDVWLRRGALLYRGTREPDGSIRLTPADETAASDLVIRRRPTP